MQKEMIVVSYNKNWISMFENTKQKLLDIFRDIVVDWIIVNKVDRLPSMIPLICS